MPNSQMYNNIRKGLIKQHNGGDISISQLQDALPGEKVDTLVKDAKAKPEPKAKTPQTFDVSGLTPELLAADTDLMTSLRALLSPLPCRW